MKILQNKEGLINRYLNCPVCNSKGVKIVGSLYGKYRRLLCNGCGLLFSNPMKAASGEDYESVYSRNSDSSILNRRKLKAIAKTWEYSYFLSLGLNPSGRLLDIGCGDGKFVLLANQCGYDAYGFDFNEKAIETAIKTYGLSVRVKCTNFDDYMSYAEGNSFDCVTMFSVVEHVEDPVKVVREAMKFLRQGGCLIVHVPSADRWPAWFLPVLDDPPFHLTLWTERALSTLFSKAGLKPHLIVRKSLQACDVLLYLSGRFPAFGWNNWPCRFLWKGGEILFELPLRLARRWNRMRGFHLFGVAIKAEGNDM
jgi:2-polyprenyl-3-methyl-5-hydroxy-6-metoxy-1,4-benzoquinol methylase